METKANYALIGAFTIAGFLGILGFLMWFAKLELNRQFAYYDVYFPEVAGLSVSSQVLFAGLSVGTVSAIELSPESPDAVRVRLEVNEDTPIRVDSRASIETSAVTGVSLVTLTPGLPGGALLADISTDDVPVIRSSPSALQTIGEQAPELLSRANVVTQKLTDLLNDDNLERVSQILINVERATGNFDKTMADVSKATDAVAAAATDIAAFGDKLDALGTTADTALTSFGTASDQATQALAKVNGYIDGNLTPMTDQIRQTAATLDQDLGRLTDKAEISLGKLDTTLDATTGTMDAAHEAINNLGPVFTELRSTLAAISKALENLPEELPRITAHVGEAAESAAGAFDSLRAMLDSSRAPVQAFAREGLPQFSHLAQEARGLVANLNQLVSTLKRNPSQILKGRPTPEFRR